MSIKRYLSIALAVLVLDWTLGMAHVRGLVPLWSFLVLNPPFGIPYFWFESDWAGTHYSLAGHACSESWSLVLFSGMVLAQAGLYYPLCRSWSDERVKASPD